MSAKRKIIIDGGKCLSKSALAHELTTKLGLSRVWNGSLDDMLYGGFGAPEEEFTLEWRDSKRSEDALGAYIAKLVDILRNHTRIELRLD